MKRYLFLLSMLLMGQNIHSQQHEFRVYRNVSLLGFLSSMCLGTAGMYISGAILLDEASTKGLRNIDPVLGIPSAIGLSCSYALLNSYWKWRSKRYKPILIFDEEGFTYEQSQGFFKERKDVRYLWKDVVSHWVSGVATASGRKLKEYWHYHVVGINEVVTIDVSELVIPKELRAKIESLRQGNIRALWV